MNLRKTFVGSNDVRFANPSDMNDITRVIVKHSPKKVGMVQRTNVKSELISNSRSPIDSVENCCTSAAYDAISVRTSISGSLENVAAVRAEVLGHISHLQILLDDMISGFVPYEAVLPLPVEV